MTFLEGSKSREVVLRFAIQEDLTSYRVKPPSRFGENLSLTLTSIVAVAIVILAFIGAVALLGGFLAWW